MPITDLTGYTWVGDENIFLNSTFNYSINFECDSFTYNSLSVSYQSKPAARYELSYGVMSAYAIEVGQESGVWYDNAHKTITITGGTDATSSGANFATLLAWLEDNGTLTAPAPAITDLTGYTWTANNAMPLSDAVSFLFDFTCNGHQYDELSTEYIPSPQETVTLYYDAQSVYTFNVGQQTGTWGSDAYKTFVITGGRDAVSTSPNFSTLLSFLYLRGTLTAPAPQLTVDLSTLLDWGSVATGSHVLTIKAKATGYRDGPLSTGVSFTKMAKLDTPGNVSVSGTEITFDEVANAESYDILVDGNSIGEYTPQSGYTINLRASNGSGAAPNANGGVKYRINGVTEGYVVTYNSNTTLENVVSLEVNCNWNGGFVNMLTDDLDGGGTEIASLDGYGNVWTNVSSHLATIAALPYAVIYCEA